MKMWPTTQPRSSPLLGPLLGFELNLLMAMLDLQDFSIHEMMIIWFNIFNNILKSNPHSIYINFGLFSLFQTYIMLTFLSLPLSPLHISLMAHSKQSEYLACSGWNRTYCDVVAEKADLCGEFCIDMWTGTNRNKIRKLWKLSYLSMTYK